MEVSLDPSSSQLKQNKELSMLSGYEQIVKLEPQL